MQQCKIKLIHISDPSVYGNPLALGFLKTYTESVLKEKVNIEILEYLLKKTENETEEIANDIIKKNPDILGFSCYIWNVLPTINLCREIKKLKPSIKIVLGGPDASIRGKNVLIESSADVLVLGEGELTFAELIKKFIEGKKWDNTPGTITYSKGKITQGPPREPIENLDIIPSPYLSGLFNKKKYNFWVYETSRGCPFNCTFCVWTSKGKVRNFSMERAIKEINWIIKNASDSNDLSSEATRLVFFADQDITMQEERAVKLLNYIKENIGNKDLMWIIECDLKFFTRNIATAGNFSRVTFCFGIQSINYELVKSLGRKPMSLEEMENKLKIAKLFSPKSRILLQLILGILGDDKENFLNTLNWCFTQCAKLQSYPAFAFSPEITPKFMPKFKATVRAGVQVFPLLIFPNTPVEKQAKTCKAIWNKKPPYNIISTKEFPQEDINYCLEIIKSMERFTTIVFGNPLIQISVQNRLI